ncbi:zf-PARP-domain-containing protein [Penicillium alfredii]|uniref:Zf-PARP-domain-containing protein n=1 Tax=Penicillium alfredii TaxID=1506179 RepID=A0A9W9FT66_9EURO|nr:zf-PARP-domain-containing protein [Penicillium alfredii]KAJ5105938.1 zf-PARP-domain-containing protein [Penicillium alfredii]
MGTYRFELASTGRSGCQNKECKDNKVKIAKDEFRVGTWVETERFQSWHWRHWGCCTPRMIGNVVEALNDMQSSETRDYNLLDGYEELPEELQAKIRKGLEQGHVDDEDWKGDVEMNRPGKSGFRARGKKKAEEKEVCRLEKADGQEAEPATENGTTNEEEEKPVKKTTKATRGKKAAPAENADKDATSEPQPKRRGRASKAVLANGDAEAETQPKRRGRAPKVSPADGDAEAEPKKRGRPSKAAATDKVEPKPTKNGTKRKTAKDDEPEEATMEKPKPKRARGKTANAEKSATVSEEQEKPKGRRQKKAEDN